MSLDQFRIVKDLHRITGFELHRCGAIYLKVCLFLSLSLLLLRRWTIRARITNKSGIRTWSNSRGDGKLFSMDLVDESVCCFRWVFCCCCCLFPFQEILLYSDLKIVVL